MNTENREPVGKEQFEELTTENTNTPAPSQKYQIKPILTYSFLIAYGVLFHSLWSWSGPLVLWVSLFTYGLLLLFFGFPFFSIFMLSNRKSLTSFGYICALTSVFYIKTVLEYSTPVENHYASDNYISTLSAGHASYIIFSIIAFVSISSALFYYKVMRNEKT